MTPTRFASIAGRCSVACLGLFLGTHALPARSADPPPPSYVITLTPDQANYLYNALQDRPFKEVNVLLTAIREQVTQQVEDQKKAAIAATEKAATPPPAALDPAKAAQGSKNSPPAP